MLTGAVAAPAAPAVGYGAAALFTLLAFLVCAGLNHAWGATLGWGFKWLADQFDALSFHVKFIGRVRPLGPIAASFRWVDRQVSHLLGVAALNTEHAFVYCIHGFAHTIEYMAAEIARLSATVYHAALRFDRVILPRWLRHAYRFSLHAAHVVERRLAREARVAWHAARNAEKAILHTARVALHASTHALDYTERWVGRTAKQARRFERMIARLNRLTIGLGAAVLVGTALERLGLRWLRCRNTKKIGHALCGIDFALLDSFLAGGLEIAALTDLCGIVQLSEQMAIEFEPEYKKIIALQDNLCLFGGASPPSAVETLYAPRVAWMPSGLD